MRARLGSMRHPLAAVLGVAGLVVGSVAALGGSPAAAAGDDLVATTTFTCAVDAFPAYTWASTLTLSATRPADSTLVTVVAKVSKMNGDAMPVALMNYDFKNTLKLSLGPDPLTLTGSGKVNGAAKTDFAQPDLTGTFTSTAADVSPTVTGYEFTLPLFAMTGTCTPTAGAALGTLKIVEGSPPVPSPTPTTTATATATPTPSSAPTKKPGGAKGTPAKGSVKFACELTIGSKFDYDAKIEVSGWRANEGDDVTLRATMSDLPGIAPVPIVGSMDYSMGAALGGVDADFAGVMDVDAPAYADVAVPPLSATAASDEDEMEVTVSKFGFDFPAAGIGATCKTAKPVSLGKLVVGTEAGDDDQSPGGSGPGTGTAGTVTSAGGELPKTGGADSLPVVALWALALTLLGAAGLLCVPQVGRRRS